MFHSSEHANSKLGRKVRINAYGEEYYEEENSAKNPENQKPKQNAEYKEEHSSRRNERKHKSHHRRRFIPVSGDNIVHRNLTRTYVFYRNPFDWYDSDQSVILDDFEEVLSSENPPPSDPIYERFDSPDRDCNCKKGDIYSDHSSYQERGSRDYVHYDRKPRKSSLARSRQAKSEFSTVDQRQEYDTRYEVNDRIYHDSQRPVVRDQYEQVVEYVRDTNMDGRGNYYKDILRIN